MYKFTIIAATLLTASALSFANTATPKTETTYTSVRHLPVIVNNEMINAETCRLSFENGSSKDVPCLSNGTETVAAKLNTVLAPVR